MGITSTTVKALTKAKALVKPAAKDAAKVPVKPKFNAKLRLKLQRQRGNQYVTTPRDPAVLAEMQSYYEGRQELKQAAYNDARGKRMVRTAYGVMAGTLGAAGALGQYQESQRKKATGMATKKAAGTAPKKSDPFYKKAPVKPLTNKQQPKSKRPMPKKAGK